jgi:pyridinium-3,5-biscarboxylic acid mononucleotide sulfurtransferase
MPNALEKEIALADWLRRHAPVLIGYSGGVDSVYLAAVATETLGPKGVLAVIGRSPSYPEEQWRVARESAERAGLRVREIDTHELNDPRYAANPTNRCYFCKTELWGRLRLVAREAGIDTILDGTNADDLADWRPGGRAASEHGVRSPLAELGFTKTEIRQRSRARDLPTWAQPSSPCLASRLPYGTAVTPSRLRQVEQAERALRSLGIAGDLRVRHHGRLARIELSRSELEEQLVPRRIAELLRAVRGAGFERVAVDLRGFRSGSLNILQGVSAA